MAQRVETVTVMGASHRLTDTACRQARPAADRARLTLFDGDGLRLNVTETSKLWRFDYSFRGKRKSLSMGRYPAVSLAEARAKQSKARECLRHDLDPVEARQAERRSMAEEATDNTLQAIALEWLAKQTTWAESHRKKVELRLRNDVYPILGDTRIGDLTPPVVLDCLRRVEARGAIDSAHRIKHTLGQICRYAIATGRATYDPTASLRGALTTVRQSSYAHITDPVRLGGRPCLTPAADSE